jgi:hypothetical protein
VILKNALAYITRKKNRTFIIFIVLVLILSSLYSCLSIMGLNNSVEKNLYKLSNSAISVMLNSEQNFNIDQFKNINKINGIDEKYFQYDGVGKLVNYKVVESEQGVSRDDVPQDLKNLVSISAFNNMKKHNLFSSGVFSIKSGRNIENEDTNKVIIHEDLASKNGLKIGDKIKLMLEKNEGEFEIVGLFTGKKQEKFNGLSSDFSENMIFMNYDYSQKVLKNLDDNKKIATKLYIYLTSPEKMNDVINEIKKINLEWANYKVGTDNNNFDEVRETVGSVKYIVMIMSILIMIGGLVVLSLILILWLRERVFEIGVLLSIGISKFKIVMQFIMELLIVTIPVIIVSFFAGNVVINQVASRIFTNITTSAINWDKFLISYGVLIVIIVLSIVFGSMAFLVKKPKDILSKMS